MSETEARLARAEAQIVALTKAVHLLTVAHQPTSKWLDRAMAEIGTRHPDPSG
jgi:hypothetical protein